jgi:hypothetical protein
MRQFIIQLVDRNDDLDITEISKELEVLMKKHYLVGSFSELMNPFWREQEEDREKSYQ